MLSRPFFHLYAQVDDGPSGQQFGQEESRRGENTLGQYQVGEGGPGIVLTNFNSIIVIIVLTVVIIIVILPLSSGPVTGWQDPDCHLLR